MKSKITFPHIYHIDAKLFPKSIRKYAQRLEFAETNFTGYPEGYSHFEPNQHFTLNKRNIRI